jgi:hypothetical protein
VLVRLTGQGRGLLQQLDGVMAAADAELCELDQLTARGCG